MGKMSTARTPEQKIAHRLCEIYKHCRDEGGCKLYGKPAATVKNGYIRCHLRYPTEDGSILEVNTTLHKIVYVLENRAHHLLGDRKGGDISHRCGKKNCVAIDHLVLESPSSNCKRRDCHNDHRCYGCNPNPNPNPNPHPFLKFDSRCDNNRTLLQVNYNMILLIMFPLVSDIVIIVKVIKSGDNKQKSCGCDCWMMHL